MRKVVPHGYRFAQPILRDYGVADRIVFNIKGNDFRLVTSVDFEQGIVWGGGEACQTCLDCVSWDVYPTSAGRVNILAQVSKV